jgi:hypothetical protein
MNAAHERREEGQMNDANKDDLTMKEAAEDSEWVRRAVDSILNALAPQDDNTDVRHMNRTLIAMRFAEQILLDLASRVGMKEEHIEDARKTGIKIGTEYVKEFHRRAFGADGMPDVDAVVEKVKEVIGSMLGGNAKIEIRALGKPRPGDDCSCPRCTMRRAHVDLGMISPEQNDAMLRKNRDNAVSGGEHTMPGPKASQ